LGHGSGAEHGNIGKISKNWNILPEGISPNVPIGECQISIVLNVTKIR